MDKIWNHRINSNIQVVFVSVWGVLMKLFVMVEDFEQQSLFGDYATFTSDFVDIYPRVYALSCCTYVHIHARYVYQNVHEHIQARHTG